MTEAQFNSSMAAISEAKPQPTPPRRFGNTSTTGNYMPPVWEDARADAGQINHERNGA